MLQDQQSTLFPGPPTAFDSYDDVIQRLLPYHIWQMYDEELDGSATNPKEAERVSAGMLRFSLEGAQCISLLGLAKGPISPRIYLPALVEPT